ncbi:MAG: polysaccharide biosynthesis/export family protein [Phycisphaerales bacterium]|nr:polysaccharide biosynthesis/export family protein [Phycisphaerales bacterium]
MSGMKQTVVASGRASAARKGGGAARRLFVAAGAAAALLGMGGCEIDGWLWDPSVVGRWEHTPTIVPVLERIDVIESQTGEFADVSPVLPEDLIPQPVDYRISPGDATKITILDFFQQGVPGDFDRQVDQLGFIELPQVGRLKVSGLTQPQMQAEIERVLKDRSLIERPIVSVEVPGKQQATFSIFGAVTNGGRYRVPRGDYRLLDAITDSGGISPVVRKVFVIRQVPIADVTKGAGGGGASGERAGEGPKARPTPAGAQPSGETDLQKLIDELAPPSQPPVQSPGQPPSNPGVLGSAAGGRVPAHEATLMAALDPNAGSGGSRVGARRPSGDAPAGPRGQAGAGAPPIDLPDAAAAPVVPPATPAPAPVPSAGAGRWVFLNGEWVQVFRAKAEASKGLPEGENPLAATPKGEDLVTQRVIEVPVAPLLQGVAQYNLVVRPGDVIHVPPAEQGFVYAMGPGIARAGTYNLPFGGRLTVQRLVASAGGLSTIAIPERVDLTRMIGEDRQATVRLNVRAIFEGNQPDIFLKSDDLLNFGTNFWATPAAVIRSGFRMSYGFGFLLDRNFGTDVFGVPPGGVGAGSQ